MDFKKSIIKNFLNNEEYHLVPSTFINPDKDIILSIEKVCNEPLIYKQLFKSRCKDQPYSTKNAEDFLRWAKEGFLKKSHYVFFILDSMSLPIGAIDIKSNDKDNAEIGYWLSTFHSGLMTNAVKELCHQAKALGFKSLYGLCEEGNYKSKSVLKRVDFKEVGILKKNQKSYTKLQIAL